MKKICKFLSVVLIVTIVSNYCFQSNINVQAKSDENVNEIIGIANLQNHKPENDTFMVHNTTPSTNKVIYLDGEKVNISTDEKNTIKLAIENDSFNAVLDVYSDGTAGMIINKNNTQYEYVLQINEMFAETGKIDIGVYENNNLIKSYNSLDEIQNYSYTGQAPIAIEWAATEIISLLISALVTAGVISAIDSVATVYGYEWYDAKEACIVIAKDDTMSKYYYPALITNTALKKAAMGVYKNYTYIALYAPLSSWNAGVIVKADKPIDLYTFSAKDAASIITESGYALERSYVDRHTTSGLQFPHFHKKGHDSGLNEFHSLCAAGTLHK